ncbi:phosphate acetyltransferase [Candidatus Woesearchaeota archaeon]|nr:phosphate acetyltransferase [Candidatus Woesearchaeota archaeon]
MEDALTAIKRKAQEKAMRIVLPEGEEDRVLRATQAIREQNLAAITLLGSPGAIRAKAGTLGVDLKDAAIIDPQTSDRLDRYAHELFGLRKEKGMTEEQAKEAVKDPGHFGTMMVHLGDADGLVSGSTHSTADTVRPALQIIRTKEQGRKVSGLFLMVLPERTLLFNDCAVIPDPTEDDLADMAIDSAAAAAAFGIRPRVAMLSFSTAGSAQHPLVDKVKNATAKAQGKAPELEIDGELQADAALIASIRKSKYPACRLSGDANVFIFPDLNSGNIAYKLVERLAGAKAVGPILLGLKKPVNDLSRGCSVQDIVDLVAITATQAQQANGA